MNIPNYSGIYFLHCGLTGKIYVGSARNIIRRIRVHLRALRNGTHINNGLQLAFNSSPETFSCGVIEETLDRLARERYWIEYFRSAEFGFNIAKNPQAPFEGHSHSEETKRAISSANSGSLAKCYRAHQSEAANLRRASTLRGRPLTPEHRMAVSIGLTGKKKKPHSIETRLKIGATCGLKKIGVPLSKEHREKLSLAAIGRVMSDETRRKLSEIRKGKPWSLARRMAQSRKL